MQIDIDFEVFKALTARRESEAHSYNEVLREILNLNPKSKGPERPHGRHLGGRFLPNGTELRAKYKDNYYYAEIAGERLLLEGETYASASAAARAVTGNNVNGLNFWDVKRPGDVDWKRLMTLPKERP